MTIRSLLLCWLALWGFAAWVAHGETAAPLVMEDQHGDPRVLTFPRPEVSVLLIADRQGSSQLEPWIEALYDRYEDDVAIEGVALLKGVPRPMRRMVRFLFRRGVPHPVMLDWTNKSAERYSFVAHKPNVFVITRDGRIHLRIHGPSSEENLARCFSGIDELL
jgi:hypothetical protein